MISLADKAESAGLSRLLLFPVPTLWLDALALGLNGYISGLGVGADVGLLSAQNRQALSRPTLCQGLGGR